MAVHITSFLVIKDGKHEVPMSFKFDNAMKLWIDLQTKINTHEVAMPFSQGH